MECKVCKKSIPIWPGKKEIICANCGAKHINRNHRLMSIGLLFLVILPLKVMVTSGGWVLLLTGLLIIAVIIWAVFALFANYELDELPSNNRSRNGTEKSTHPFSSTVRHR